MKYILTAFGVMCLVLTSCIESNQSTRRESNTTDMDTSLNNSFGAGFQIIKAIDSTRVYKAGTLLKDSLYFRPLDVDVWYPAQTSVKDTLLRFGHILGLLEKRANLYSAPNRFDGLTKQVAQSFCELFQCAQPDSLLMYKTNSLPQGERVSKKFPLLIYLCSYNGMSYENFTLYEALAKQGYVVAVISSIGRYPGEMTMKTEDLMQQVGDANFVLNRMKRLDYIDSTKIGLIGYSWGGLAAAILAMHYPKIKAVVSLDGSEFHHYGQKEEDEDFEAIINSTYFKPYWLTVPYLRLESNPEQASPQKDSVYNFLGKIRGEKRLFKVKTATHQDFSCLPYIVKSSGNCKPTSLHATMTDLVVYFFEGHLKNQPGEFEEKASRLLGKTLLEIPVRK